MEAIPNPPPQWDPRTASTQPPSSTPKTQTALQGSMQYGMSASQLGLSVNKRSFSWLLFIEGIVAIAIILSVLFGGWWYFKHRTPSVSALVPYDVTQSSPEFSTKFYPHATVQQKDGNTYLITVDQEQRQTALWIMPIPKSGSYGTNATFQFTLNGQTVTGGHDNTDVYTADVVINNLNYQINLTSQRPVSLADAKAIFSSINVEIQ